MNDNPINNLILPILIKPILIQVISIFKFKNKYIRAALIYLDPQLEKRDSMTSTLRAALTKAEQSNPGLTYELVLGIIKKGTTFK